MSRVYFEFLSNLVVRDLGDAVSKAGGAGAVFRKFGRNDFQTEFYSRVVGYAPTRTWRGDKASSFIVYCYEFYVDISINRDDIYFRKQRLFFLKVKDETDAKGKALLISERGNPRSLTKLLPWDLAASYSVDKNLKSRAHISRLNSRNIDTRYLPRISKTSSKEEMMKQIFSNKIFLKYSLLSRPGRYVDEIDFISDDMFTGSSLNIIPNRVKASEDIAKFPEINDDGSGLAATLFMLKRLSEEPPRQGRRRRGGGAIWL